MLSICATLLTAMSVLMAQRASAQVPDIRRDLPASYSHTLHSASAFTTPFKNQASDGASREWYLFAPVGAGGAKLASAPVVVYFHGWEINPDPKNDRALIMHFVRSGYTVIYPRYCSGWCTGFASFLNDADAAVSAAMWQIQTESAKPTSKIPPIQTRDGRFVVHHASHSLGSYPSSMLASKLGTSGATTAPRSLIFFDPAGHNLAGSALPLNASDLAGIRSDTLMLILGAQQTQGDANASNTARRLFHRIPAAKKFAWVVSHQCVSRPTSTSNWVYNTCPTNLGASGTTSNYRYYYSGHNSMKSTAETVDNMAQVSFFNHASACLTEAETGVAQNLCSLSGSSAGVWLAPGGMTTRAKAMTTYSLPAP